MTIKELHHSDLKGAAKGLAEDLVGGFEQLVEDAIEGSFVGSDTYRLLELAANVDTAYRYADVFERYYNDYVLRTGDYVLTDEDLFTMISEFNKQIQEGPAVKFLMHTAASCALSIIRTGHDCIFFKLDEELEKIKNIVNNY